MIVSDAVTPLPVVGTYYLSQRWKVTQRTVLKICRAHRLKEVRPTEHSPILFLVVQVEALEREWCRV